MLLPVASAGHLSAVFASPSEIKTGTIAIKTHWFPTHWLDAPWCFPRWWTWNFKGSPLKSQNTPRYWKGCTKRKYTKILGWFLKYIKIHQGKKYTKTLTLIPKIHQKKIHPLIHQFWRVFLSLLQPTKSPLHVFTVQRLALMRAGSV